MNKPVTTIAAVRDTIETAYTEQAWLLVVLKSGGWADNTANLTPAVPATVGTVKINELRIRARRETVDIARPTLSRIKITVDFRVPDSSGEYTTVASLRYPTEEDIRWQLSRLNAYTGFGLARQIADRAPSI